MDTPLAQPREILAQRQGLIVEPRAENARPRAENGVGRGLVAQVRERIAELEAKLGPPSGKGTPDFVKASRKRAKKEAPREKGAENFARKREEPTQRIIHAMERCTGCGCGLLGGSVKHTRQLPRIPIVPLELIDHLYLERECPQCGRMNVPEVDLSGEVAGKSRLSAQTMALIATMRETGRLPIRSIQCRCGTFHRLSLSVGEIVGVPRVVRDRAREAREGLIRELRGSPVAHGDETSWREGGQNGYPWGFSSPTARYFEYRKSRGGPIVTQLLGENCCGVLVSDSYGGYNRMLGMH